MLSNYYKILGIPTSATETELRRAYRILARRYHPDVNPGAQSVERFKLIAEAYGILSDPEKRKQYDLDLKREQANEQEKVFTNFRRQQNEQMQKNARERYYQAQKADYEKIKQFTKSKTTPENKGNDNFGKQIGNFFSKFTSKPGSKNIKNKSSTKQLEKTQFIEISLRMQDAL